MSRSTDTVFVVVRRLAAPSEGVSRNVNSIIDFEVNMKNVPQMYIEASRIFSDLMIGVYQSPFDIEAVGKIKGIKICLEQCGDLESVVKINQMLVELQKKFIDEHL